MTLTAPDRDTLPGPPGPPPAVPTGSGDRPPRGGAERPGWARPGLLALLAGTAVLYLWGLSANGYANDFYAAAAQAGSQSWKAWFFGSLDAGNAITVDKTPASLWAMGLSIRIFGLSSWALLVPQALMGVGTVALVVAAVRRTVGRSGPALLAGAVMALTPVAAVMFRFDNPDALLTLLLTGAAYAVIRALQGPRSARWLALAGALVGFAFLAKMLQAFLVLPGFALAYLVLGPTGIGRRLLHLVGAGAALLLAGGWWVAIVQLWPASSRPYIGGSTNNSILELALGYNGLARLTGTEGGPQSGTPGLLRLFGAELGGQIAWLLPAALLALVAGLVLTARAPRTDRIRAGLAVWGGWLLVTGLTFSFMAGVFHSYYVVALAPAVAALVGIGVGLLWPRRGTVSGALILAAGMLLTTTMSFALLSRSPDFLPWLRWVVLFGGLAATAALAFSGALGTAARRTAAGLAVAVALAGPAAYSVQTIGTAHTGSMPSAGPSVASSGNGGGFTRGAGFGGPAGGGTGQPPSGSATPPSGTGTGTGTPTGTPQGGGQGGNGAVSSSVVALLEKDAGSYTWVAATNGSMSSAPYQLATGDAVMAIGGFNGGDDSPTLAQFQADVAAGKIHYYISGGMGGGRGGGQGSASQIASWVAATYTAQTVDGVTVYDLTS
jgi:4-amino-4-deoxy-L-arabinose transferase-like glycosyltransferase